MVLGNTGSSHFLIVDLQLIYLTYNNDKNNDIITISTVTVKTE